MDLINHIAIHHDKDTFELNKVKKSGGKDIQNDHMEKS